MQMSSEQINRFLVGLNSHPGQHDQLQLSSFFYLYPLCFIQDSAEPQLWTVFSADALQNGRAMRQSAVRNLELANTVALV